MNKKEEITKFIKDFNHPLEDEIFAVRDIILSVSDKITETIKWSAPTFEYQGSITTFNMRAKKFVNLTFHKGALINDPKGVLEGDAKQARVMRFTDMSEINAKKEGLKAVIRNWILLKETN